MDRMIYEYYHTTVVPYLKPPEEAMRYFFGNFYLRKIVHAPLYNCFFLSPSITSPTTRLHSYGVIKCPSADSLWPQTPPDCLL